MDRYQTPVGLEFMLDGYYINAGGPWEEYVRGCHADLNTIKALEDYGVELEYERDGAITDLMEKQGWQQLCLGDRAVFYRGDEVIKIGTNAASIRQNYMEVQAYASGLGCKINGQIVQGRRLAIPYLVRHHAKYYWVVQQRVRGRGLYGHELNEDIIKFVNDRGVRDARKPENWLIADQALWLIDLGHYQGENNDSR